MIIHAELVQKLGRDLVVGDLVVDPTTGVGEGVGAIVKGPGQQLVLLVSEEGGHWETFYDSTRISVVGRKEGAREALPALGAPDWREP